MNTSQPETVIARYITVGGATIDITNDSPNARVSVTCTGCTWSSYAATGGLYFDTVEQTAERVAETLPAVRDLAQSHAETCRAMPM